MKENRLQLKGGREHGAKMQEGIVCLGFGVFLLLVLLKEGGGTFKSKN